MTAEELAEARAAVSALVQSLEELRDRYAERTDAAEVARARAEKETLEIRRVHASAMEVERSQERLVLLGWFGGQCLGWGISSVCANSALHPAMSPYLGVVGFTFVFVILFTCFGMALGALVGWCRWEVLRPTLSSTTSTSTTTSPSSAAEEYRAEFIRQMGAAEEQTADNNVYTDRWSFEAISRQLTAWTDQLLLLADTKKGN
jgi:hypothetical protein